ncbi:MAG: hypothetical protein ACLPQY_14705 [Streptosporangiaceae bacterium]
MSVQLIHEEVQTRTTAPTAAGGGRLRSVWHRIRLTVQEMNYSARRIVEVQAPWIVDEKPHSR